MKKLTAAILVCMMLVSCGSTISEEQIIENLDEYVPQVSETSKTDEKCSTFVTGVEGIITTDWVINDGKYYFVNKRESKYGGSAIEMITYLDFETGNSSVICPDPLCEHEEDGECKYAGFQEMFFVEPGVFYTMRVKSPDGFILKTPVMSICKVDLNLDTVTEIFETEDFFASLIGVNDGKFYLEETITETIDKKTVKKTRLYSIDIATDTVENMGYLPEKFKAELGYFYGFVNGELYYYSNGFLKKTDLGFENTTDVIDKRGYYMDQLFFDSNTGEIYYSLINETELTGGIYVYRNGITERVILPDENIYAFTLTQDKIYYSTYNPFYYGVSAEPGNPPVYDYSGGQVYMVDRENPVEATLVYDCAGEYVITNAGVRNYSVFAGDLYFTEAEIVNETVTLEDGSKLECTYFSSALNTNKIRIDLVTGELTRYQFD